MLKTTSPATTNWQQATSVIRGSAEALTETHSLEDAAGIREYVFQWLASATPSLQRHRFEDIPEIVIPAPLRRFLSL